MKNIESFLKNPSLSQTQSGKSLVEATLRRADLAQKVCQAKDWFVGLDSQLPYSKHFLMSVRKPTTGLTEKPSALINGAASISKKDKKAAASISQAEKLKSYIWLKNKLGLTDKDIRDGNKVNFEQYLKTKNLNLFDSKPFVEDEMTWEGIISEIEYNDLDLPMFDEEDRLNLNSQATNQPKKREKKKTLAVSSSLLGRKSIKPVLQEISNSESEEEDPQSQPTRIHDELWDAPMPAGGNSEVSLSSDGWSTSVATEQASAASALVPPPAKAPKPAVRDSSDVVLPKRSPHGAFKSASPLTDNS